MKATGHIALDEPFAGMFTQGMVVHETYQKADGSWVQPAEVKIDVGGNGRRATLLATGEDVTIGAIEKMSKSKKNTVDPTTSSQPTAPTSPRWFMLSDSPPDRDVIWSDERVQGASRFVQRLWRLVNDAVELGKAAESLCGPPEGAAFGDDALLLRKARSWRARKVTSGDRAAALQRLPRPYPRIHQYLLRGAAAPRPASG